MNPYRQPAERERGPRWGVTWWRKMYVSLFSERLRLKREIARTRAQAEAVMWTTKEWVEISAKLGVHPDQLRRLSESLLEEAISWERREWARRMLKRRLVP